jgi:preprotein translocase subunit SecF
VPLEIIKPGTHIDFIGRRKVAFAISSLMLLAGLAAVFVKGVNLGIDFAGGTEVQLRFAADSGVSEAPIRELAEACGVVGPTVVRYGEGELPEFLLSFNKVAAGEDGAADNCPLTDAQRQDLEGREKKRGADTSTPGTAAVVDRILVALEDRVGSAELMRIEYVGPRVGQELREDGLKSMGIACLFILGYIAFRFSSRFAPGAVVALVHDVGITAGIFVIFGLEFDLRVLAALLAILGYSLNDTIIIYDRIRENLALHTRHDLIEVLNLSVNQTLSRTLLTSLSTIAAVLCLLVFGGKVIQPFALAMTIGIVVGTYSSTFIAAPTLLYLEQRFGGGGGGDAVGAGGKKKKVGAHPNQRAA